MRKGVPLFAQIVMLLFYTAIVFYILFAVLHADALGNCLTGVIFQIIGTIALFFVILSESSIKTGYAVPAILAAILYAIVLATINFFAMAIVGKAVFLLLHLVLLFIYLLASIPLYYMGMKE